MKKHLSIVVPIILTSAGLLGLLSDTTACTKAEETQVITAITDTGACIADIVLAVEGVEDPTAIGVQCSASVSAVYAVVVALLNNETIYDASPVMAMSVPLRAHLIRIQANAQKIIATGQAALSASSSSQ